MVSDVKGKKSPCRWWGGGGGNLGNYFAANTRYFPQQRGSMLCNGKSLCWMGLTRERWCCTKDWMGRLDMNTCQTSIKTNNILL